MDSFEWDEKREQDWELLKYPLHDAFYRYMKELNHIYLDHTALSEADYQEDGFQWLDCHQEERCIYTILRQDKKEKLVAVFNFGDQEQEEYQVQVPGGNEAQVLLYSDWNRFGGTTLPEESVCTIKNEVFTCKVRPFSGMLIKVE